MREVCINCMIYVEVDDRFDEREIDGFSDAILNRICPDNLTYEILENRLEDDSCH